MKRRRPMRATGTTELNRTAELNQTADFDPEGIPPMLTERIPGWIEQGIDPDELLRAARAAGPQARPGTPGWVEAFASIGQRYLEHGRLAEIAASPRRARAAYLSAAFYFSLARFP